MEEFQEHKDLVLQYIRGIWRNRWIAIMVAWPLMLAGVMVVDQIKDRYVAETKVYLDSSSILRPLLQGLAIETDFHAIVELMIRKLLSRPNLERAIRLMDMDIEVKTPSERESLIGQVRKQIEISAIRETGTYTISYSDTDRIRARRMVQTLLDIFVEDTLGKSVFESGSAIAFLDQQIEKYDLLLQQAEERREAYKRKNVGLMPQDGVSYYSELQQLNSKLEDIVITLGESVSRRDKLTVKLAELTQVKAGGAPVATSFDKRISEQETQLVELLLLYTDQHPDVINARMVLEALEKRRDKELLNPKPVIDLKGNKVHQEIQILLTKTEADISSLQARRGSYERKERELTKLVEIMPRIEAGLQRLNRDYDVHKKNYTELVERREKAKISEDVESGTEQVKFRIIEPPYVPLSPNYPNRPLFDLGVLIAALGFGYGLSLLISLFQPVYYSTSEMRKLFEYTVLGAIKKFDNAKVVSIRRMNLTLFAMINLTMIATLVVLAYLHSKGFSFLSILQSRFY